MTSQPILRCDPKSPRGNSEMHMKAEEEKEEVKRKRSGLRMTKWGGRKVNSGLYSALCRQIE